MLAHELDYIAHFYKITGGNMEERGSTMGKNLILVVKWTKSVKMDKKNKF